MINLKLIGLLATIVAILIAFVAGIGLFTSVRFVDAEQSAQAVVKSENAYFEALDNLKDAVIDAETGQRGYLLTGNKDYLNPYTSVRGSLNETALSDWASLAFQDGSDTDLRQLVDFKLTELDETIRLFETGNPQAALRMIQSDRGQDFMRQIRAAIELRQIESRTVADAAQARTEAYGQRTERVSTYLAALLGLATIMGAVTIYLWVTTDKAVSNAEEAVDSAGRIEVIANELNHRMKNMFAITQGMLRQSARGRGDRVMNFATEASERIMAMSHAYSITQNIEASASMSTDDIIDRVVRAQLLQMHKFDATGQTLNLKESAVTPLALILHEWTTNTLKYGAWNVGSDTVNEGDVTLNLSVSNDEAVLLWDENSDRIGQPNPTSTGYGSKLIKACAAQLGGRVSYDWHDHGVRIALTMDKNRL
ncbi:MAG: sensor histidine kinase [Litorimonas sp.]